jgi:mitotic spindle assembly checkpoint protein MAD1
MSFPSPTSEDAATLHSRLQTLSSLHQQATEELAEKGKELAGVEARLSVLAQQSASAISEWTKRAQEAERELRWAREGRASAERREALAKAEVEATRTVTVSPSLLC